MDQELLDKLEDIDAVEESFQEWADAIKQFS